MLSVEKLSAGYGQRQVLHEVDLVLSPKECVAILGHNGAAKSTLVRTIFGLHPALSGRVVLDESEMASGDVNERLRHGIAYVPQNSNVFPTLSIEENLRLGLFREGRRAKSSTFFAERVERVYETFPKLRQRSRQVARTLSGGERQMLALGIALMTKPSLLLLDEPSRGLSPSVLDETFGLMRGLCESAGIGLLLVEQRIEEALAISHRVYVLRSGTIIHQGIAASFWEEQDVWSLF